MRWSSRYRRQTEQCWLDIVGFICTVGSAAGKVLFVFVFVCLFQLSWSNATRLYGVRHEWVFLLILFLVMSRRIYNLQVFSAPAIKLVCSWLKGRPRVFPAPVKTGLLLTNEERDVCPTRLVPDGRAGYPRHGFRIFSLQLGACESVTKCLRPLFLRCQRRRRLPLLKISLRGKIVGVILYWWGIVLPVWLIPTILAGLSGPFRVVFPTYSPLAPQNLDSKARCVAPTALPFHKANS